jgi:hypothetical protein
LYSRFAGEDTAVRHSEQNQHFGGFFFLDSQEYTRVSCSKATGANIIPTPEEAQSILPELFLKFFPPGLFACRIPDQETEHL